MEFRKGIFGIVLIVLLFGCKKDWEEHYNSPPATSNENVWDVMQKDASLSTFVQYLKANQYDTLFASNNTYTVFAPDNNAFAAYSIADSEANIILDYHISPSFIQSGDIQGTRKIQMLGTKFALFVNNSNGFSLDDIPITFESPLYRNGRYYKISRVAIPKPNIYEYIAVTNPILKAYIDIRDSIILDKELSKPIGFDDQGNTIYDTVAVIVNNFERKYFPVKHEFRNHTATLVFPKEEDYNAALTTMAQSLGLASYVDYTDIPQSWQNNILIPYLLHHGIFENMLEENEFQKQSATDTVRLKSILGDSVDIDYMPAEKTICSNGYAYNYANFKIPDTLYASRIRYEGEWLLKDLGNNKYAYRDSVEVSSSTSFSPMKNYLTAGSNDSIMTVNFPRGYTGTYMVKFNVNNLFPRKYRLVVRTNIYVGGIYKVYINGLLVKTFDYSTGYDAFGSYMSITGKRYPQQSQFNIFDCWVTNLTEYGKAEIMFEYAGPGDIINHPILNNGLVIDYVEFVPSN